MFQYKYFFLQYNSYNILPETDFYNRLRYKKRGIFKNICLAISAAEVQSGGGLPEYAGDFCSGNGFAGEF